MRRLFVVAGSAVAGIALFVFAIGALTPQSVDVSASVLIDAPRAAIYRLAAPFRLGAPGSPDRARDPRSPRRMSRHGLRGPVAPWRHALTGSPARERRQTPADRSPPGPERRRSVR